MGAAAVTLEQNEPSEANHVRGSFGYPGHSSLKSLSIGFGKYHWIPRATYATLERGAWLEEGTGRIKRRG